MYPKINRLKDPAALRARLAELNCDHVPVDDAILSQADGSPLAASFTLAGRTVGNRWCIHPMEGWDANRDGSPTELTLRRWKHFGLSGAKLIWGGEAAAVQPDGRANPNQTLATPENRAGLSALLQTLFEAHRERFGSIDDLVVGLQLTHSGRFSRPNDKKKAEPRIAYHHPLLDVKAGIDPHDASVVWTDDDLERLIDAYVAAAKLAAETGFHFVDVKACHGYLLHEFLSARTRPGKFGGDFDGRTRVLREIIGRVRNEVPSVFIGVRLSAWDVVPYQTSREVGQPMAFDGLLPYEHGFGVNPANPLEPETSEPIRLLHTLHEAGVSIVNVTGGSPYYNPHVQRPAIFPPSDGYLPPEDPLVGVNRHLAMLDALKQGCPAMPLVATAFSYLQDYTPHVAQAVVRAGWAEFIGLGRMVLSYPDLPADSLETGTLARKKICRTFSDCTTAPRNGLVSGCYPLDPFYKDRPEAELVKLLKKDMKEE